MNVTIPPSTLLTPEQCSDALGGEPVVEVRVPAVTRRCDGRVLLAVDARLAPVDDDWATIGGAMAADLPNPNSLLLAEVDVDTRAVVDLRVVRRGQTHPRRGFSDPCIFAEGDRVCLVYARSNGTGFFGSAGWQGDDEDPGALHIDCSLSFDGGRSFTHHPITSMCIPDAATWLGSFVTSGHGVVFPATGQWLAPMVVRTGSGQQLAVIASADYGETWQVGETIGTDMDETALVIDGEVLRASSRSANAYRSGALGRWETQSFNGGRTWVHQPQWVPDPPAAACNACLVDTPQGVAFIYPGQGRQGGFVHRGGVSTRITTGHYGYCDAVVTGDEVDVFFEHEGAISHLRFV